MKKQVKKGMSLFLSVLMLLSCWVWVAPTKAAAISGGNYTLRIGIWVENGSDNDTPASIEYGWYENNGRGTTLKTGTKDIKTLVGNDVEHTLVEMAGFPVYLRLKAKSAGFCGMVIKYIFMLNL